jgi:hypothetical protein
MFVFRAVALRNVNLPAEEFKINFLRIRFSDLLLAGYIPSVSNA